MCSLGLIPLFVFLDTSFLIYAVRIQIAVVDDDVTQDVMRNWATYIHSRVGDKS